MSRPLETSKYINKQRRQNQMTWISRAMAIPENATLHIWGRKHGLKKAAWDCRKWGCPPETTRWRGSYNGTVLSDPKNRNFYLQLQLKMLFFPETLLKAPGEMWKLARGWENSHAASLLSLSLMPFCLVNIAVYSEITHASVDSFVGDIFLIKLLWTIMTEEFEISTCFHSSESEKNFGNFFSFPTKE